MNVRILGVCAAAVCVLLASGCGTQKNSGKYYDRDGPPKEWETFGMSRADAVPKVEKPIASTNRPYTVMGKRYVPMTGDKPLTQVGYGSWYGKQFHGKKTSTGEIYNMYEMSAAHTTMELPSYARVTNLENGKSVIVRVNDRGPFLHSRVIDLSDAAATKLGYAGKGTARVKVERITRAQIASGKWKKGSPLLTTVLAAIPKDKKETSSPVGERKDPGEALIEALATQSGNLMESPSPVTADKVEIEKAAVPSSDRHLIPEGVYTVAGADSTTTLGTFENEIREEVIHSIREQASDEKQKLKGSGVVPQGNYAVQLGVFRSEANAIALKKRFIETLGDKIGSDVSIRSTNGLYKVVAGKSMTEQQAKSAVAIIRDALNIKAFTLKE